VAAGRVVFATLGRVGRLEYTVIGEAVNFAAKLEKHNKAEGRRPAARVAGVAEAVDIMVFAR
jgi:adenylate cyclase